MRKISSSWQSRPVVIAASAVGSLFVAGIGWAAANAASAPTSGVIYACADKHAEGLLRLVKDPKECRRDETSIEWNITGPTGAIGAQGLPGVQGPQGAAGAQGAVGPQGAVGAQGAMGEQGIQGVPGAAGAVGAQGPAGTPGATGAQGIPGPTGAQGPAGNGGPVGPTALQNVYLQLPGIDGPVTEAAHASWFAVSSFALSVVTPTTTTAGAGAGSPKWALSVTFAPASATPAIYIAAAAGTVFSSAPTIFEWEGTAADGTPTTPLHIELSNAALGAATSGAFDASGNSSLTATISFGSIAFTSGATQGGAAPVSTGWDLASNQAAIRRRFDAITPGQLATSYALGDTGTLPDNTAPILSFVPPSPTGANTFSNGSFTLTDDSLGAAIFVAAASGKNLSTADVSVYDSTSTPSPLVADYKLGDARFPNVAFDGTTFTVGIVASKYNWSYGTTTGGSSGGTAPSTPSTGWNIVANTGS